MTQTLTFLIQDPDTDEVIWNLSYNPSWATPFVTVAGSEHIWNWDFVSGALLQDGEPLLGYSVVILQEA